jgi:hypothetical protein
MSNDLRANQELIDEMRAMNAVLDEYFYRVAYEHFERQTSVALWPVKIAEQAEKAKDFCAAIRAKYLQAQIGEQAAFADALNELQEFALSFDQYTSLDVCEEAASKARDCMRQVEEAGEQARLFNARELLFEREVTVLTQRLELRVDGVDAPRCHRDAVDATRRRSHAGLPTTEQHKKEVRALLPAVGHR